MSETAAPFDSAPPTADATTRRPEPSALVVEALASAEGVDPVDLDVCLFEYVDPGALDALFAGTGVSTGRAGSVSFLVEDRRVTVEVAADAAVEVRVEGSETVGADGETVAEERRDP
jgi:hypothetical protein